MKQAILLSNDLHPEGVCASSAKVAVGALFNRTRRNGLVYAVHEDIPEWLGNGEQAEILFVEPSDLDGVYEHSMRMSLCPYGERDIEGKLVAIGIGPYQEGILNRVLSNIKKLSRG